MSLTTAIGLMSGTSMDGIDIAVVTTDGEAHVERRASDFVPYDAAFRRRLGDALETARTITRRDERPGDLAELEDEITRRHAEAVTRFLAGTPLDPQPGLIGFHGQTVLHRPERALTVQLGDGALLARRTELPVIWDMRANDMLHGGQGAPLAPVYHAALAHSLSGDLARFPVALVNIGGISNITYVPGEGDPIAFDTGPGNALIDQWVSRQGGVPFDAEGMIASEGGVVVSVVERYMEHLFFEQAVPKSLDRNDFTIEMAAGLELADGARTLARVSAEAIFQSLAHLPKAPRLWVVGGGGRKNPHIMADMRALAGDNAEVILAEESGFNGDSMEAEAWAYLAVRAARDLPLTFPATTGCREPVSGGILSEP